MLTSWLLLGGSVLLVAAAGVFVAAEFSFVTVDRSKVAKAADAGDVGAAGILKALRSLSTQLSGAQVGITVTNLAIGYLAEQMGVPPDDPGLLLFLQWAMAEGLVPEPEAATGTP